MFRIRPRTLVKAALLPTALLMAAGVDQPASRAVSRQGGRRRGPGGQGEQRARDGHGHDSAPAAHRLTSSSAGSQGPASYAGR